MLSSVRRGPSVLRTLRTLRFASPILSSPTASPRLQNGLRSNFKTSNTTRTFSSKYPRFQEAALAEDTSNDETHEFTKFEELAEAGVIDRTVIETITQKMNIHTMTEVQRMTLNQCLKGDDVIAQARTGTGKTIAFLLPIIQRIIKADPKLANRATSSRRANLSIKGLIISPTRELAEQIAVEARKLVAGTGVKVATAVGGTRKDYHLRLMQDHGCHLLIGTPGRVNDILSDSRSGVNMDNIETFVLDEADRLLDIGFAPAIEEIQSYMPHREAKPRQTLMFSATVPKSVVSLVRQTMRPDFKFVRTVDPDEAPTHERVPQKVTFLEGLQNQAPTILEIAMKAIEAHKKDPENNMPFKAIVYFGSTNEVNMMYDIFQNLQDPGSSQGRFSQHPLSPTRLFRMNGKLDQNVRTRESEGFRRAESALLFSSDVTARGMDFPNVSHVIQVGLPKSADDYVHRLGRTGRAGKTGEGWLLLNKDEQRAFNRRMVHPGLKLEDVALPTATLDMTKPTQLAASVARMMQMIESGVKSVPYRVKSSVYASLLGVLPQQFPDRQKQDQIDMMNELARYGWGMQTPPSIPRGLVNKLGYGGCQGIELETDSDQMRGPPRGGRTSSRNSSFDQRDPFGMGQSGKGVFGGESRGRGSRFGDDNSFDSDRRRRPDFGDRRARDDNFDDVFNDRRVRSSGRGERRRSF